MRIGAENELWTVNPDGSPFDISMVLPRINAHPRIKPFGSVTTEPGLGSLEFVGSPAESYAEAAQFLREVQAVSGRFTQGVEYLFAARSPWYDPDSRGLNETNPRYAALAAAAFQESAGQMGISKGDHGKRFAQLNFWAALHVHYSHAGLVITGDKVGNEAAFLASVVNLTAPFLSQALCAKYGVMRHPGHLSIYDGWVRRERSPHYGLWHRSGCEYVRAFNGIPRLMRLTQSSVEGSDKTGGIWEPDLESYSSWGNPADDGSTWWPYCRLRPKYGTAEMRFLPSWPQDERLERVIGDLARLVEITLDHVVSVESVDEYLSTEAWRKLCLEINTYMLVGQSVYQLPNTIGCENWQEACAA